MSLSAKLRRAPLRIVTGAFILNSGIGKLSADENTAKMLHGMATGTYPFLGKVQPKVFAKGLAGVAGDRRWRARRLLRGAAEHVLEHRGHARAR
jgi:hypothetical protein